MFALFLAPLLLFVWGVSELQSRKQLGLEPATWRRLWAMAQKKGAPNSKIPALFFVLVAAFGFAYWEGILRLLLNSFAEDYLFLSVGTLGLLGAIAFRLRAARRGPEEYQRILFPVLALWFFWCLSLGAWASLVLLSAWVGLRLRSLNFTS